MNPQLNDDIFSVIMRNIKSKTTLVAFYITSKRLHGIYKRTLEIMYRERDSMLIYRARDYYAPTQTRYRPIIENGLFELIKDLKCECHAHTQYGRVDYWVPYMYQIIFAKCDRCRCDLPTEDRHLTSFFRLHLGAIVNNSISNIDIMFTEICAECQKTLVNVPPVYYIGYTVLTYGCPQWQPEYNYKIKRVTMVALKPLIIVNRDDK
ncbi:hypothetical protein F-VV57_0106 [Faustovirus]|nr:hypothetical protein F-VV57_0106 [Faustovirus]QJX73374.1 hypothetical protein F-VV63_0108 [Faustovirus]